LDQPTIPTATPAVPARPSSGAIWAGIWVLYLVWGSTYLGIAIAIETIPPFLMAATRFAIAGLVLLAWAALRHSDALRTLTGRQLRDSLVVGALLLGGGMGMVAVGEQTVPSGLTAIFIALMPLWVAVFGRAFFGERLPALAVVGIAVGLVGVVVLAWPGDASLAGVEPIHLAAVILSPISWSLGSLYSAHRASLPTQPQLATGLQMVLGSLVLVVMATAVGELARFDPAAVSDRSFAAMVYLTVIGSLLAFSTFAWLLRVAPLPKVATYAYVNPIVAVILGFLILGEPITPRALVAGAIVVVAVALIVTARGRVIRGSQPDDVPMPDRVTFGRPASESLADG
jgi:drug/metabolite transporter (DMT)-like permease